MYNQVQVKQQVKRPSSVMSTAAIPRISSTPNRRPPTLTPNAPTVNKKRALTTAFVEEANDVDESGFYDEDDGESMEGNQLAHYDYDGTPVSSQAKALEKRMTTSSSQVIQGSNRNPDPRIRRSAEVTTHPEESNSSNEDKKGSWEVDADTDFVEMEAYVKPGTGPRVGRPNYKWKAGRSDGQFMVVLGHNTVFKVKLYKKNLF